jgi:hypothetical protein
MANAVAGVVDTALGQVRGGMIAMVRLHGV